MKKKKRRLDLPVPGVWMQSPIGELMLYGSQKKIKKRSNIVTNSTNTLNKKMVHIFGKKNLKKNKDHGKESD